MAVWGDTLYVYGGHASGVQQDLGCVVALYLLTGTWELLHWQPGTSARWPEGRKAQSMWAAAGRLYILGGRTVREWASWQAGCAAALL